MDLALILILVGGSVLAIILALILGKFFIWFSTKMEQRRAKAFLMGKAKNETMLDGEKININKFKYKTRDGEFVLELNGQKQEKQDIVQPDPPKEP